jgi:hypothetical protein
LSLRPRRQPRRQRFSLNVPLEMGGGKPPRLDAYVCATLPQGTSRARVAAAIRDGALTVNGRAVTKPSQPARVAQRASVCSLYVECRWPRLTPDARCALRLPQVRAGDALLLALAPPPPMEALPEALPLEVRALARHRHLRSAAAR